MNWKDLARRNWTEQSWPGRFHLFVHAILPPGLLILGWHLISVVRENIPNNCDYAHAYLPAPWIVAAGIVGLICGRYFTRFRVRPEFDLSESRGSVAVGQLALMFLLLMLSAVWFYEAIGTAHVSVAATGTAEYEPITFYVRCAAYADRASNGLGINTMLVVFLICFLIGHWLWSSRKSLQHKRRDDRETSLA